MNVIKIKYISILFIIIVLSLPIFLISCEQDETIAVPSATLPTGCDTLNVNYSTVIAPILSSNCLGCHNADITTGSVNLDGYNNVKTNVSNGKLATSTKLGGAMFKYLSSDNNVCQSYQIKAWINKGAPNN